MIDTFIAAGMPVSPSKSLDRRHIEIAKPLFSMWAEEVKYNAEDPISCDTATDVFLEICVDVAEAGYYAADALFITKATYIPQFSDSIERFRESVASLRKKTTIVDDGKGARTPAVVTISPNEFLLRNGMGQDVLKRFVLCDETDKWPGASPTPESAGSYPPQPRPVVIRRAFAFQRRASRFVLLRHPT